MLSSDMDVLRLGLEACGFRLTSASAHLLSSQGWAFLKWLGLGVGALCEALRPFWVFPEPQFTHL